MINNKIDDSYVFFPQERLAERKKILLKAAQR